MDVVERKAPMAVTNAVSWRSEGIKYVLCVHLLLSFLFLLFLPSSGGLKKAERCRKKRRNDWKMLKKERKKSELTPLVFCVWVCCLLYSACSQV